jgi:hypothetical protein
VIKKEDPLPNTVPLNLHFLAVRINFDTFHFQIFYLKNEKDLLIRGKLLSLQQCIVSNDIDEQGVVITSHA